MQLNELRGSPGSNKARTRVGRGIGSGKGKTCGRGQKGQKARTGVALNGYEGGQNPLFRRLPKRGFNNPFRIDFAVVNTGQLQSFIAAGKIDASKPITRDVLYTSGVVTKKGQPVKLLAKGDLKDKVQIEIDRASKSAIAMVEKAKGTLKCLDAKCLESKEK